MALINAEAGFLLATPSWVIPGTYVENLRFLNGKSAIGGVELLFFLYDEDIRRDFLRELPEIRDFAGRFVFTAHLPDSLKAEHEELVETLSPLVKHFIVHPAAEAEAPALARLLETWEARYGKRRFLLENTGAGKFEAVLPHFDYDAPVCMDTAHLLMENKRPAIFAGRFESRLPEIHLNGVEAGGGKTSDHKPLKRDDEWLRELAPILLRFRGVVNIELFSWADVQKSAVCLEEILRGSDV
jgi:hypothetical protein